MRSPALCLLLLITAPLAAVAQPVEPGKEGELALILKPEPGAHACFRREYDQEHLTAHPKQTVTAMELRLAYHRHDPDTNNPEGQRNYYFDLIVKRRGKDKTASGGGECTAYEDRISCGIDCDGGGFFLKRAKDGKSLVVDFGEKWGIRLTEGCGEDESDYTELKPGADDKSFRLDPSSAACPAYEQW
ncbi:MAG: hypothetical protein ACKVP5_02340 [Aestuariivirga sp.]